MITGVILGQKLQLPFTEVLRITVTWIYGNLQRLDVFESVTSQLSVEEKNLMALINKRVISIDVDSYPKPERE